MKKYLLVFLLLMCLVVLFFFVPPLLSMANTPLVILGFLLFPLSCAGILYSSSKILAPYLKELN